MRFSPLTSTACLLTLAFTLACAGSPPPQDDVLIGVEAAPAVADADAGAAPAATPAPTGTPAPARTPMAKPPTPATPAAQAATEYPGTAQGVCQRLQDCNCPPMASVAACARVLDRDVTQARQMMDATGLGEMAVAIGGGDMIEQSLYVAANSKCVDACKNGTNVFDDGSGGTRLSGGSGMGSRTGTPGGGGRTTGSWNITINDNTTARPTGGSVSIGSDLRVGAGSGQPTSYTLVVRSLDGEWVDVKVDGRTAVELRNSKEGQTSLSPGVHTVEVYEFMDEDRPLARARITTGATERIVIGVAEERPVECYDPSACTPL